MTAPLEIDPRNLDLARFIRPGDTVIWSQGTGEPEAVVGAFVAQRHAFARTRVFLGSSYSDVIRPEHADAMDFIGIGAVGRTKAFLDAGVLDVIPCHLSELGRLMASGRLRIDVVIVHGSRNARGELSYGANCSYLPAAVRHARVVIAEINEQAPWTHSSERLERVDAIVPVSRPLVQLPAREADGTDREVARRAAELVEDGDILQIGIGLLPDAVLAALRDRRDLGIHSGVIGDGVVDLVERGVVTNATKGIDRGITVTGGLFGSERLYRFAHGNAMVRVEPVTYTHAPEILGRFDSFVTINSAVEVDLTGQVNGEVSAAGYLGTVGGQTDFARAAMQSPRGRSIIALPSRTGSRKIARIVPRLTGGIVSAARADTDIVVTEHGVAHLRGQPLRERVRRMISIAHPDDREMLEREASAIPGVQGLSRVSAS
jgi:acetyl-CoA hydrolase